MKGSDRAVKKRLTAHKCDCGENIENREGNFNWEIEGWTIQRERQEGMINRIFEIEILKLNHWKKSVSNDILCSTKITYNTSIYGLIYMSMSIFYLLHIISIYTLMHLSANE